MGMYLGQQKVGYTSVRQEEMTYENKPAIKTESVSKTRMKVLGMDMTQDIQTIIYTDPDSTPLYQEFRMSSGGKTTVVLAVFNKDNVSARILTDGSEKSKKIPIPAGTSLIGDPTSTLTDATLKVGDHYKRKSFNPLTLTLDDLEIDVTGEETLTYEGKQVQTLVVETKTPLSDLTTYQDAKDGQPIRIDTAMGIVLQREPQEKAVSGFGEGYEPPQDFAVMTSVRSNVDLPSSGRLQSLDIRLTGIPEESFVLSDARQQILERSTEKPFQVTFLIRAAHVDPESAATLPVRNETVDKYLQPAMYIESDAVDIQRKARSIVAQERNLYRAAQLIRAWVHDAMDPKSDMGILRSSTDVLKNPVGVCRDYAVLYAALARAAGVPTRVVGGLVFSRGDFYYHAWNEVWIGDRWVPVDSTLSTDFVDASHIKLTEGDATDMFRIARIIGQLKAEVTGYK